MSKNIKLHVKNVQIADAINLRGLKAKLSKKKPDEAKPEEEKAVKASSAKATQEKAKATQEKAKVQELQPQESKVADAKVQEVAVQPAKAQEAKAQEKKSYADFEENEKKKVPRGKAKLESAKDVRTSGSVKEQFVADASKLKNSNLRARQSDPESSATQTSSTPSDALALDSKNVTGKPVVKPEEKLGPVFRESKVAEERSSAAPSRGTWREVPQQSYGNRPQYDRPQQRSDQDRPSYQSRTPYQDRGGQDRPPYQSRTPYQDRGGSERGGQDRGAHDRGEQDRSTYQSRPPYQDRGGDRPAYQSRTSGPGSYNQDRPPYQNRGPGQGSYNQDRPSYQSRTPYQDRAGQDRSGQSGGAPGRREGGYPSRPGFDRRPGFSSGPNDARRTPSFARPQPFNRAQPPIGPKDTTKAQERGARSPEKKDIKHVDKENRDPSKTARKGDVKGFESKNFDSRSRRGFAQSDDDQVWRKRRPSKMFRTIQEQEVIRPSSISVRFPISVKDLAQEMKLKASELISKLFLQGQIVTLNDLLDDETMVQLLGHEFGCEISIDKKEDERIRITDKSIKEEVLESDATQLITRPPVVAFMGHVDHGKTSLIDAIRKTNRVKSEVGAITQHIGAFRCHTNSGDITVLDTPGHEAFSHMRERGAEVTDIVVLVVAGDEGMRQQSFEALQQAQDSNATILVAINKCDKPNFDAEQVYRQLAEKNLLPEAWGGQTITVNCSAVTGEGITQLLEMLAIQAEVLEIKANPMMRARGTVIESQMDKGLGPVSTVLVQNGTLKVGDCLVFGFDWARVKTMRDQDGDDVKEAGPSMPVRINGLSGLPESGEEFIVVHSEREAREISGVRNEGKRQSSFLAKKRLSFEGMVEKAQDTIVKKVITLILRGDVQGSVEALKNAFLKIDSNKVEVNIISTGVGLITESDVQRAHSSKAVIVGFHTQVESHLESLVKELGVQVRLHDIIYHAVDDIKELMRLLLDKIKEEKDTGKVEVKALFKSSQLGTIAGCQVLDGTIHRNNYIRVKRGDSEIWKGPIASLKRVKEDVREVSKGMECGIILQGFTALEEGDILEAFEVIYLSQDL